MRSSGRGRRPFLKGAAAPPRSDHDDGLHRGRQGILQNVLQHAAGVAQEPRSTSSAVMIAARPG